MLFYWHLSVPKDLVVSYQVSLHWWPSSKGWEEKGLACDWRLKSVWDELSSCDGNPSYAILLFPYKY